MKIVMLSSEANPFIKTGGLADVVYSLSKELALKKHDVTVILPFYESVHDVLKKKKIAIKKKGSVDVTLSWRHQEATLYETKFDGVSFCLIENPYYFTRHNAYGYGDDGERFAFFTLAARNALSFLGISPDIVHLHDWHVGMFPLLIKKQNLPWDKRYAKTKFVFTIHNPAFKGYLDRSALMDLYGLYDDVYRDGSVEDEGMVSTLKAGISYADKVTTVSPSHAKELLDPHFHESLANCFLGKEGSLIGIVNGIDEGEFDPRIDPFIAKQYDEFAVEEGKKACRKQMLSSFSIPDKKGPIFGIVSRLTYQKGIDLVLANLPLLEANGAQLIVLGSGEADLENSLRSFASSHNESLGLYFGYNAELAHQVYAGCDFFLMPSLFEPCGIGQMIAEKYGTLPLGRATGGIQDTILDPYVSKEDKANGFLFNDYNPSGLAYAINEALKLYRDKPRFQKMKKNAMTTDHSWKSSAKAYEDLYRDLKKSR